jgi:hypothetical protein
MCLQAHLLHGTRTLTVVKPVGRAPILVPSENHCVAATSDASPKGTGSNSSTSKGVGQLF